MFSTKITDSDAFIEMSSAAQALYLHLNQSADDDGFNNQVQVAMMKAHASVDDLKVLMLKRFVIRFENGLIVIKHWRMHNTLRMDRYTPTAFQEELAMLKLKPNLSYTLGEDGEPLRLPDGCHSIDKESIDKDKENNTPPTATKKTFEHEHNAYKLAAFLAKKIMERVPNKNISEQTIQSWAGDFDKLNRIDKQDWKTIDAVLDFSQSDTFWQNNILSGATFRKQYDKLYLKMPKESA
jgi:hypothetical protein